MIVEIVICLLTLILGFQFPKLLALKRQDLKRLKWLWVYHLLFGVIYYYYVLGQGGSDSLKYWLGARDINGEQALLSLVENKGTRVLYALNYIPSNLLNLSFFSGTILYCLIGFMGLAFFYKIAITVIPYNYKILGVFLFPTLFYLPNLHFWSGAIGKDTLLFFCVGLFAFSLLKLNKRIPLILLALAMAYIVRPHIALFLALGYSMAYLMDSKLSIFKRVVLFSVLIAIGIAILPSVLEYTKIEELTVDSYEQFSERKVGNLSRAHTGSTVDVSSYPLPIKIFTFLYRPTIIDINSATSLIAAIENMILLILSVIVLSKRPIRTFGRSPFVLKGLIFFLMIGTVAFALSLGNLGIMLRMRNMFLPGLLIFICWSYSFNRVRRISKMKPRLNPNHESSLIS